jgi:hypothetical protein
MPGKGNAQIGRGHTHVAQGELIFLRPVKTHLHAIHGTFLGHLSLQDGQHTPFGQQELVGRNAFEGIGRGVALIEAQELVQEGRTRAPVAQDEQRWFLDGGRSHLATIDQLGKPANGGTQGGCGCHAQGILPEGPIDGKVIPCQEGQPMPQGHP